MQKRCRLANAPAGIGADREEAFAGGDGGCGASAAPTRDPLQVPRVVRRVEGGVLGGGAHGELVHVAFAQEDAALLVESLRDGGAVGRNEPLEHAGRTGGGDARRRDVVLDLHRDAGEGPGVPGGETPVGGPGLLHGHVGGHGHIGLDPFLGLSDPVEARLGEINRRDLPLAEKVARLVGGQIVKAAHRAVPVPRVGGGGRLKPGGSTALVSQDGLHPEVLVFFLGAFIRTSSLESEGLAASSRRTLSRSMEWAVGGTSSVSTP